MFVARQLRHISPATTLTVYAHLFDSAANIGGVGGTGLRTSSATPLLSAEGDIYLGQVGALWGDVVPPGAVDGWDGGDASGT